MGRIEASLVVALIVACGSGCAAPAAQGVTVLPSAARQSDASDWTEAEDLLSARMRSVASGIAATGHAPSGFAKRGFLASGARATHAIEARAGHCVTVVALATTGVADLDATIFDASGHAISQDAASDARPVLRACARDEDRSLYYVLHAFRGNGAYLVVAFEGPLVGAGGGESGPDVAAPTSPADWTAALVRRGFEPEGPPVELDLTPESPVRLAVPARSGECVALLAFAQGGAADVNLRLSDEAGVERVSDEATRAWAGVQLCPDAEGVLTANVEVRGEAARVLVGRFAGRSTEVGGEHAMWLGDEVHPEASLPPGPPLTPLSGAQGHLGAGVVEQRSVRLPRGSCVLLRAELGGDLEEVRLRVATAEGTTLGEAKLRLDAPGLHVCGADGRKLSLQIEAARGAGDYALLARSVDVAALRQMAGIRPRGEARVLDLMQAAASRSWSAPEIERLTRADFACGPRGAACELSRELAVPEGQCVSVAAIDAAGRPLSVHLSSPGEPDAHTARGFTTRCAHAGAVALRIRSEASLAEPSLLLRAEHAPASRR